MPVLLLLVNLICSTTTRFLITMLIISAALFYSQPNPESPVVQAAHDPVLGGLGGRPQAVRLGSALLTRRQLGQLRPHPRRVREAAQAGRRPLRLPGGHAGRNPTNIAQNGELNYFRNFTDVNCCITVIYFFL